MRKEYKQVIRKTTDFIIGVHILALDNCWEKKWMVILLQIHRTGCSFVPVGVGVSSGDERHPLACFVFMAATRLIRFQQSPLSGQAARPSRRTPLPLSSVGNPIEGAWHRGA